MWSCKNAWKIKPEAQIKKWGKKRCCWLALLSFTASSRMPPWLATVIATHLYFAWPYGRSRPALWRTHATSRHSLWQAAEQSRAEPSRCLHPPNDGASCAWSYATQLLHLLIGASGFSREDAKYGRGQMSRSGSADGIKREITREVGHKNLTCAGKWASPDGDSSVFQCVAARLFHRAEPRPPSPAPNRWRLRLAPRNTT